MSAQDSSHTPGPPPRHGHPTPRGANSLRRTSDRFEGWFRRVLMVVLVLGLPVAAVSAGMATYGASMGTVRTQAADRHQVTARLTAGVESGDDWAKQLARVRWTDTDGVVRTGSAMAEKGTAKGAALRIWVTRNGTVTGPPTSTINATTSGWMVGGMAAFGVVAGVYAVWAGMRLVLNRRRYAQWAADWGRVEPQWSSRFHP
jgi:hypothetical protein